MRSWLSWIEQRPSKPCVGGSNPSGRTRMKNSNTARFEVIAPIAQLDRVTDFESGGRRFKSYWARSLDILLICAISSVGRAPDS